MAAKKTGKPNATPSTPEQKILRRISPEALRKIWGAIQLADWKNWLNYFNSLGHWDIHNDRVTGLCPFHGESKPSFVVDTKRKFAKCYGCGKYFWNPIQFAAALRTVAGTPTTYLEALKDLKDRFELKDLPAVAIKELSKRWKHRQMKKLIHLVSNAELCAARDNPTDPRYAYAQKSIRYLDHRGIPRAPYDKLPIGILPVTFDLEAGIRGLAPTHDLDPDEAWAAAKMYLDQPFLADTAWQGALMMFTGDNPSEPCGVKIRQIPMTLPPPVTPGFSGTFFSTPATAPPPPPNEKFMLWVKDEIEGNEHGLFGLYGTPLYANHMVDGATKALMVVEGEFDALNLMANQFAPKTGVVDIQCLMMSAGGSDVRGLDWVKEFGFDTIQVIGDRDDGGDRFIRNILEKTLHMNMRVFIWPTALDIPGKAKIDPDDVVKTHGLDVAHREFRRNENYWLAYRWAAHFALQEMVGVDDADVKMLTAKAGNWGVYVRDKAEQDEYLRLLHQKYPGINGGTVRAKINAQDQHEEAFIDRIHDVLRGRLYVMALLQDKAATIVRTYDTVTRRLYDFRLNDNKQILGTLQALAGGDVYRFIRDTVGDPGFTPSYDDLLSEGGVFYANQVDVMSRYACFAVARLGATLAQTAHVRYLGAGFHLVYRMIDGVEHTIGYLVNGMLLFKRDFTGENLWRKCPGPADGDVIIFAEPDHTPPEFYPQFTTEAALNAVPKFDLPTIFKYLTGITDAGWDFLHQDTTPALMAAFMMNGYISDIFARQPVLFVTAEQSSGKSCLIGGLIGRTAMASINVIQPALFSDNYTTAGVKNAANNGRYILALDEFEHKGLPNDPKSRAVEGVLGLARPLANEGGLTLQAAGASGRIMTYNIRLPMIMAGIRSVTTAEDLSRFIFIEMAKKGERASPEVSIFAKYTPALLKDIKESLPMAMFNAVGELMAAHQEIKEQYKHGVDVAYGGISRNREQYYSILAIMKVAKYDYDTWLKQHYEANRSLFARVAQASLSADIFRALIATPKLPPPTQNRSMTDDNDQLQYRTVKAMLASATPHNLNDRYAGVYFDTAERLLVVDWPVAKQIFLRDTEWWTLDPSAIRNLAARNKYHMPEDVVPRTGVLDRLKPYLRGTHSTEISVFNVQDLLNEAEDSRRTIKVEGVEDSNIVSQEFEQELAVFGVKGKKAAPAGTSTDMTPSTKYSSDDFDC